jgi:hypothetical protein
MITPMDAELGRVAKFDPEKLLEYNAAPARPAGKEVRGHHYFVCVGRTGKWSLWVPAFSRHLPGRIRLGYKAGSAAWTGRTSFIELDQFWIIPDEALGPASIGVDLTRPGHRDYASWKFLLGTEQLDETA